NFQELPVNRPIVDVHSYNFEGHMWYEHTGNRSTYVPNSFGDSWSDEEGTVDASWESDGELVREDYTLRNDDGDFVQPGILVCVVMYDSQRESLSVTVAGSLDTVTVLVLSYAIHFWNCIDVHVGQHIVIAIREGTFAGDQVPGGDPLYNRDLTPAESCR